MPTLTYMWTYQWVSANISLLLVTAMTNVARVFQHQEQPNSSQAAAKCLQEHEINGRLMEWSVSQNKDFIYPTWNCTAHIDEIYREMKFRKNSDGIKYGDITYSSKKKDSHTYHNITPNRIRNKWKSPGKIHQLVFYHITTYKEKNKQINNS